jgi:hypothetical protein
MRRLAVPLVLAVATAAAAGLPGPAPAQQGVCLGDLDADAVAKRPGPLLRFGINPAGEAGAFGPRVEPVPDDPPRTLAALGRLRPRQGRFVVRLNRFFWSDGEAGIQRFLALTRRYTAAGYPVELQLRYHPRPEQEGDVAGFVAWVREVVRRFGPNPLVVAAQVTNEVNLTFSPDSSDGAYRGARDALVQGVIAAKDEARRRGHRQLEIGFNWVYRMDPSTEDSFWSHLRDRGGPAFVSALDWVGLDAYPGTFFPPVEGPGGERDGMVNAMSQLRRCFMPKAGIPDHVPIHVEENGWPTGPGRPEQRQAEAMDLMVWAVHDFRGTYNVTDYRWFDLRDHNTSSLNFQHHYGLLRDDYSPKPAFGLYQEVVEELARREPPVRRAAPRRPRLVMALRHRWARRGGRRCALSPVTATLAGPDARTVRRVEFHPGGRRPAVDSRPPFRRALRVALGRRTRSVRVRAVVRLRDGRRVTLARTLRVCGW